MQWPAEGRPASPKAWLLTVASRRLIDELRSDEARRRREPSDASMQPGRPPKPPAADDTLTLLFLCCHPALSAPSQLALTLRAVAGLTTAEIARAFLVPEATMAQRISRAKQKIPSSRSVVPAPPEAELADRLRVVLHVLYLLFNEGYTATSGPDLARIDLSAEAIRLTSSVLRLVPDDGEVAGLLALMLLTDARRAARTAPTGALVPLDEQDRTRWDADEIAEGVALVTGSLAWKPLGPYQVQAAIAAVHAEAARVEDPDWPQILALYGVLQRIAPSPWSPSTGPSRSPWCTARAPVSSSSSTRFRPTIVLAASHHFDSVRAHLLELVGDHATALAAYQLAARRTRSLPERQHLLRRDLPVVFGAVQGPNASTRPPPGRLGREGLRPRLRSRKWNGFRPPLMRCPRSAGPRGWRRSARSMATGDDGPGWAPGPELGGDADEVEVVGHDGLVGGDGFEMLAVEVAERFLAPDRPERPLDQCVGLELGHDVADLGLHEARDVVRAVCGPSACRRSGRPR